MEISDSQNPNVYGSFNGAKDVVVSAFSEVGWKSRKFTWDDYEIENDWSELIVEGI